MREEGIKMSKVILFDLDGTITDSAEGITKSVQYALSYLGIEEPDLKKLERFVGPPLKEQFMKYSNLSEKQAEIAIALYRERYVKTGIYENKVYDGIESVLRLLKAKGKVLGIASSKPTIYVRQILEHFKLAQYFTVIVGSELDGTRTEKAEVIEYALELLGMQDERFAVLMVGDRAYDVEGALHCGIQCIGVAYGYGGIYELEKAGAIYIAQTVEDLKVLTGSSRNELKEKIQEDRGAQKEQVLPTTTWNKAWRVLYPLGLCYLIMIGVALAISLIMMALNGMWYGYDIENLMTIEAEYPLLIMGVAAVVLIPIFIVLYRRDCFLRAKGRLGRGSIDNQGTSIGVCVATVFLMISASQALNMLIKVLGLHQIFRYHVEDINNVFVANNSMLLTVLVVGMLVPIMEELVFRGLVFRRLSDYAGNIAGIFVSGLIFGIYHENMIQFIYATILGWLLAFVFSQTDSMIVPIIGHMVANLWSIIRQQLLPGIIPEDVLIEYIILGFLIAMTITSLIYMVNKKSSMMVNRN